MKYLMIALALLWPFASSAGGKECFAELKSSNPVLNGALIHLNSFEYVLHALQKKSAEMSQPQFCVSGMPLSQNSYLYKKFYLQIEISDLADPSRVHTFNFLYQDASIQAHHNVGGKPWTGMPSAETTALLEGLISKSVFHPWLSTSEKLDPLEIAKKTRLFREYEGRMDVKSLSALPLSTAPSAFSEIYLVTFMTQTGSNPFSAPVMTKGLLIAKTASEEIYIAENISVFSDILSPMELLLNEGQNRKMPNETFEELLLRL